MTCFCNAHKTGVHHLELGWRMEGLPVNWMEYLKSNEILMFVCLQKGKQCCDVELYSPLVVLQTNVKTS